MSYHTRNVITAIIGIIVGAGLVVAACWIAPDSALLAAGCGIAAIPFLAWGLTYTQLSLQSHRRVPTARVFSTCGQCIAGRHHATHNISINTPDWGRCSLAGCQCPWTGGRS